jgi:uracil phosphoribosyltransferase
VHYFERFVGQLDERTALIIDPMLATAGSMIATVTCSRARGCKDVRALVLVAAPEGVAR